MRSLSTNLYGFLQEILSKEKPSVERLASNLVFLFSSVDFDCKWITKLLQRRQTRNIFIQSITSSDLISNIIAFFAHFELISKKITLLKDSRPYEGSPYTGIDIFFYCY
jgi:hypothetical protein